MRNDKEAFNKELQLRNQSIEELNKNLKIEYETFGGHDLLVKYIMSETIAPIEDYENVVALIRENYQKYTNVELLIIGAYSAMYWTHTDSEMLGILNLMSPFLQDRERAIIHYLNAYKIYMIDGDFILRKDECCAELNASELLNIPFVNNKLMMAELATQNKQQHYSNALSNVQEVFVKDRNVDVSVEHLLNPQSFINEFILGTHMSQDFYEEIIIKARG